MRRPRLLLVAVFLLGALLAGSGAVVAATVIKSGKAVTAVKVATETDIAQINSSDPCCAWSDIAGMSLSINVPSGERALLLITFSAQAMCSDGYGTTARCSIMVLVDGNQALPGEVIFASAGDAVGAENFAIEANSMQFVAGPLNAGTHTIKVRGAPNEPSTLFALNARTLSVLRSRV